MAKRFDVLTLGLTVIDLLVSTVDESIFARETSNMDSIRMLLGGDALNQAIALSALGSKTCLLGVVGNDQLGEVLLSRLAEYPITVLERRIEAKTGISIVMSKGDGERHFLLQTGHNAELCYDHIDEQAVRDSAIVSIGSCMSLKSFDGADTVRFLELARSGGALSAMDFKINRSDYDMPSILESFRLADYLLPSEGDVKTLTGEGEDPVKMAQGMHDLGGKNVIIKLGERGCYVSAEGVEKHIPALPANCVDATGAGDSFVAAFLHGKARGWEVERCARFANAAGAIAVEQSGANGAIRSERQVLERMN